MVLYCGRASFYILRPDAAPLALLPLPRAPPVREGQPGIAVPYEERRISKVFSPFHSFASVRGIEQKMAEAMLVNVDKSRSHPSSVDSPASSHLKDKVEFAAQMYKVMDFVVEEDLPAPPKRRTPLSIRRCITKLGRFGPVVEWRRKKRTTNPALSPAVLEQALTAKEEQLCFPILPLILISCSVYIFSLFYFSIYFFPIFILPFPIFSLFCFSIYFFPLSLSHSPSHYSIFHSLSSLYPYLTFSIFPLILFSIPFLLFIPSPILHLPFIHFPFPIFPLSYSPFPFLPLTPPLISLLPLIPFPYSLIPFPNCSLPLYVSPYSLSSSLSTPPIILLLLIPLIPSASSPYPLSPLIILLLSYPTYSLRLSPFVLFIRSSDYPSSPYPTYSLRFFLLSPFVLFNHSSDYPSSPYPTYSPYPLSSSLTTPPIILLLLILLIPSPYPLSSSLSTPPDYPSLFHLFPPLLPFSLSSSFPLSNYPSSPYPTYSLPNLSYLILSSSLYAPPISFFSLSHLFPPLLPLIPLSYLPLPPSLLPPSLSEQLEALILISASSSPTLKRFTQHQRFTQRQRFTQNVSHVNVSPPSKLSLSVNVQPTFQRFTQRQRFTHGFKRQRFQPTLETFSPTIETFHPPSKTHPASTFDHHRKRFTQRQHITQPSTFHPPSETYSPASTPTQGQRFTRLETFPSVKPHPGQRSPSVVSPSGQRSHPSVNISPHPRNVSPSVVSPQRQRFTQRQRVTPPSKRFTHVNVSPSRQTFHPASTFHPPSKRFTQRSTFHPPRNVSRSVNVSPASTFTHVTRFTRNVSPSVNVSPTLETFPQLNVSPALETFINHRNLKLLLLTSSVNGTRLAGAIPEDEDGLVIRVLCAGHRAAPPATRHHHTVFISAEEGRGILYPRTDVKKKDSGRRSPSSSLCARTRFRTNRTCSRHVSPRTTTLRLA
ncbi:hypothetical protein C7M84_013358 [Penaeus vannamei]|uniref:Uncharacterized protein n=1 Tax=Penaeus vannamei TaxID=6689 RepID=A0A423SW73_PENVA|nr:hypothetical protein C7M84_013358 [Penaeus vannamei]